MPFDPALPATHTPIVSAELRNQFNGLHAGVVPVGCVVAYLKNLPNAPALPVSWAECHGQVLNDAESPFNGQTLPDLNGAGGTQRFLRGAAASGTAGGADSHVHDVDLQNITATTADGGDHTSVTPTVYATTAPNPPASALPSYYEVVWVLRVK